MKKPYFLWSDEEKEALVRLVNCGRRWRNKSDFYRTAITVLKGRTIDAVDRQVELLQIQIPLAKAPVDTERLNFLCGEKPKEAV